MIQYIDVLFQFFKAVFMLTMFAFYVPVDKPVQACAITENASSTPDIFGNHVFSYHAYIFGSKVNQSPKRIMPQQLEREYYTTDGTIPKEFHHEFVDNGTHVRLHVYPPKHPFFRERRKWVYEIFLDKSKRKLRVSYFCPLGWNGDIYALEQDARERIKYDVAISE